MPQVTLKVDAGKVIQGVRKIGEAIPRIGDRRVKAAMNNAMLDMRTEADPFPGMQYQRTHRYSASWKVYKRGNKSYTLESDVVSDRGVHYSRYVGGDANGLGQTQKQATWPGHVNRWNLLKNVVEKWAQTLLKEVNADLRDIIRGVFGGEAGGL